MSNNHTFVTNHESHNVNISDLIKKTWSINIPQVSDIWINEFAISNIDEAKFQGLYKIVFEIADGNYVEFLPKLKHAFGVTYLTLRSDPHLKNKDTIGYSHVSRINQTSMKGQHVTSLNIYGITINEQKMHIFVSPKGSVRYDIRYC